jgi:YVTN family beta-propeller protein
MFAFQGQGHFHKKVKQKIFCMGKNMKKIFRVIGVTVAGMLACGLGSLPVSAQSTFVYVNNEAAAANSISAFSVGTSGALTPVPGSPFATGGSGNGGFYYASNGIAATTVGNFLFASDDQSNDIAAFSINTSTGALTAVPGSPFAYGTAGANPYGIALAVTPDGKFLYVGDGGNGTSGDIWGFSIASNGALTPITGSPFAVPASVDGINVTRDGKYLAATLPASAEVAMFNIGSGGALAPVTGSPFSTGGGSTYADSNCASNLLFAADATDGETTEVSVETIAAGALSSITGSPFTFDVGGNSNVGVLGPYDNFLFVSNQSSNTVTSLSVATGGSLSEVTGSPFADPAGGIPLLMGTNQTGTLLFVVNGYNDANNSVSAYNIGGDGSLSLVAGSPFATGISGKASLTVFPPKTCGTVTSTPGPFAYVTNINSNNVSVINIPTSSVVNTIQVGSGPWGVAVSPDQSQLYVSNNHGNNVSVINAASSTVVATIPVQSSPFGVAFTPDGSEAFVVNGSSNSVSIINTDSQSVAATVPVQQSPVGVAMALTSNGTFAYVTNSASNSVSVIAVNSSTVLKTIPVGSGPRWVAVAPNSSLAYVENAGSNTVSVISVATNTVTATIPVGMSPFGAAFTPDSSLAYVVNGASNTVSVIDTASSGVIATMAGFSNPVHVALSSDGSSAYVTNLNANNVSVIATTTNTITGTVAVGSAPIDVAIAAAAPTSQQITQPLSPTQPNVFNFGTNTYTVQYPAGTHFSNIDMTVDSVELTQTQFQQRVAGTQFANATCIVYSGAGGNCVDDEVTCSRGGSPISCPGEAQPTIAVQTSFATLQGIINPGYLTTPIGENDWANIFSGFSDPTVKGKTTGFSEFVAVSLGANNPQGLAKLQILYPIFPKTYSHGQTIPIAIRLTSIATGKPVTDAEVSIVVVMTADAHGNPTQKTVFAKTDAFVQDYGAHDYLFNLQAGKYAAGTYTVTIYGNAFPAFQGQFKILN